MVRDITSFLLTKSSVTPSLFFISKLQTLRMYTISTFPVITLISFFNKRSYSTNIQSIWRVSYRFNTGSKASTKFYTVFGFISFFHFLRYWLIGLSLSLLTAYGLIILRSLSFARTLFAWLSVLLMAYWLISIFTFFLKKYQYGKFTTAIARFFRRTLMIFWLIELFLFFFFLFLTLIVNNESFYMLDQIQIYKSRLYSWRLFLPKLFVVTLILLLANLTVFSLKWGNFSKPILLYVLISFLLFYSFYGEFYQFYHVSNFYSFVNWNFDSEEKVWSVDYESRKTRLVNHYINLLVMLKFWHVVIIVIIWVYFLLRINEYRRARYNLLAANVQNFVFLYIFCWVFMYPWLKYFVRRYFDYSYFWFGVNFRRLGLRIFFNDLKLFFYAFTDTNSLSLPNYSLFDFFYWKPSSNLVGFQQFRSSNIRSLVLQNL